MNTWLVSNGTLSNCGAAAAIRAASRFARSALRRHNPAFDVGQELHRGITTLAGELPGALATELEVRHPGRIEEHHGFGIHAAILDDAERQHIDARLPGQLGRGHVLRDQRIRESRAVHMQGHAALMGDVGQRADFRRCVHRAAFRGLRDGQHARLHAVHMRLEPRQSREQILRQDLRARTTNEREFRAAGEKLRRTTFVTLDVRLGVGQYRAPGRTQRGEGQRIRGGARGDREYTHARFEEFTEHRVEFFGPLIRTICERDAVIGVGDGREDLLAHRGRVIRFEKRIDSQF